MQNEHILRRLDGIQMMLKGAHCAGRDLSSTTKGDERQKFVDSFLSQVLPIPFRFGRGDATYRTGNRSGQLDVVIEYPFLPSLPIVGSESTRLFLAEGIAAVIEVKSNIAVQCDEVLSTGAKLCKLKMDLDPIMEMEDITHDMIPFFAVGYEGWKTMDSLRDKLIENMIDGILVIDPGLFVSSKRFGDLIINGSFSLWGLISCLHKAISSIWGSFLDPMIYSI